MHDVATHGKDTAVSVPQAEILPIMANSSAAIGSGDFLRDELDNQTWACLSVHAQMTGYVLFHPCFAEAEQRG